MPAPLTPAKLAGILRRVPEKKFRIFELAPQLVGDDGAVDINKAMTMQGELNLAIAEVQSYVSSIRDFRIALGNVEGNGTSVHGDLYDATLEEYEE